jgi:hypothetical protein
MSAIHAPARETTVEVKKKVKICNLLSAHKIVTKALESHIKLQRA